MTNVVVTLLVACKAWCGLLSSNHRVILTFKCITRKHRQFINSQFGSGRKRTNTENILILLIESGVLYCLVWVSCGYLLRCLSCISTQINEISLFIGHYIRISGQNLTRRFLLPLSIQLAVSVLARSILTIFLSICLTRASIPPSLLSSLTCSAQY